MHFHMSFSKTKDSYFQHNEKHMKLRKLCRYKSCPGTSKLKMKVRLAKSPFIVLQHIKNPAWVIEKPPVERSKRKGNFSCFSIQNSNSHTNSHASTSKLIEINLLIIPFFLLQKDKVFVRIQNLMF